MGEPMDMEKKLCCAEEEEEISLIELMVQLLSGWKKILLLALLFALLLGGYRGAKGLQERSAQGGSAEAEEKYQTELAAYEAQRTMLGGQIADVSESIRQNNDYRESSALMQLDPHNYAGASIVYYINAGYTVDPNTTVQTTDPTASLVRAYETGLQQADFYQYLADALEGALTTANLQELVTVRAEADTAILSINVAAENLSQAEGIEQAVRQYVESQQSSIGEKIAAHDLKLLTSSTSSHWVRNGSRQEAAEDDNAAVLNAMGNPVAEQQQEFTNTLTQLNQQLEDLRNQESALEEPEAEESGQGLKLAVLKFVLIGLVVGAFLGCGWITLDMLLGDRFCDEEELQQRYGLPLLGSLRRFPEKGLMNRLCATLAGDQSRQSDLTALADFAHANVAASLRNRKTGTAEAPVLLAGSRGEKLSALNAALQTKSGTENYRLCGDILRDPAAVAMLQPGTRLVICEEKGSASRQTILNELRKLRSLGCDVLGIISL